jgi:hypothetical protein
MKNQMLPGLPPLPCLPPPGDCRARVWEKLEEAALMLQERQIDEDGLERLALNDVRRKVTGRSGWTALAAIPDRNRTPSWELAADVRASYALAGLMGELTRWWESAVRGPVDRCPPPGRTTRSRTQNSTRRGFGLTFQLAWPPDRVLNARLLSRLEFPEVTRVMDATWPFDIADVTTALGHALQDALGTIRFPDSRGRMRDHPALRMNGNGWTPRKGTRILEDFGKRRAQDR